MSTWVWAWKTDAHNIPKTRKNKLEKNNNFKPKKCDASTWVWAWARRALTALNLISFIRSIGINCRKIIEIKITRIFKCDKSTWD